MTRIVAVCVLVTCMMSGCVSSYHVEHVPAHPEWDGITPGLMLDNVQATLGPPSSTFLDEQQSGIVVWCDVKVGKELAVSFEKGKVTERQVHGCAGVSTLDNKSVTN